MIDKKKSNKRQPQVVGSDEVSEKTFPEVAKEVITKVAGKMIIDATKDKPVDYPKLSFKLAKLVYENSIWKMILDIDAVLPRVYMRYFMNFIPNEESYDTSLENEKYSIKELKTDPQKDMFNERSADIRRHEAQIKEIEKTRREFLEANPPVKALVHLIELKNQIGTTRVTFMFPAPLIEFLNAKRTMLSDNYLIQLKLIDDELES